MRKNRPDVFGLFASLLAAVLITGLTSHYGDQFDKFTLTLGSICSFCLGCCFKGALDQVLVRKLDEMKQKLDELRNE